MKCKAPVNSRGIVEVMLCKGEMAYKSCCSGTYSSTALY